MKKLSFHSVLGQGDWNEDVKGIQVDEVHPFDGKTAVKQYLILQVTVGSWKTSWNILFASAVVSYGCPERNRPTTLQLEKLYCTNSLCSLLLIKR